MPNATFPAVPFRNQLLARLPATEFKRLRDVMETVVLPAKKVLYSARSVIDYVYFPISGVVSAMMFMEDGRAIEVATIGNEGVVGLTAFIGGRISPYEVMVQLPGEGCRIKASAFAKDAVRGESLRRLLILYHIAFSIQVSYSVACNGLHTVQKRCCRWLLMTQDRMGSDLLPLTHEFLGIMLGVRRASVSEVLHPLQQRGLIKTARGTIEVLDRSGLESLACECYRGVQREFSQIFGLNQT